MEVGHVNGHRSGTASWRSGEHLMHSSDANFDMVSDSWAPWLTVDDGRTVEEVRRGLYREGKDYEPSISRRTTEKYSKAIECPNLMQQMNLFMQIDEIDNDGNGNFISNSPRSSLPKPVVKRRRNNIYAQTQPAMAIPTTRKNHHNRYCNNSAEFSVGSSNNNAEPKSHGPGPMEEVSNVLSSSRRRSSAKLSSSSTSLSTKCRRERHSFGDKLMKAFGVKQTTDSRIMIGSKTAKLLQAVDSMQRSNSATFNQMVD